MPMGSIPQERPVAQSLRPSLNGDFLKESIEAKAAREKASVERAKEKKEEILWKSLRTANVAMQIEIYFRSGPKEPSLQDIMRNIEVPAGSVNKEFLRMVGMVAERFNRQRKDVDAVMAALTEQVARGGGLVTNQEIARLVCSQIHPWFQPSGLQLTKREGYLVLAVSNHDDYHALYGEDAPAKKSGGRFHRALYIAIAGREVPVIVHPGSAIFNEDTNEVMIHEKQHWINESLVKLGFIESERPSLLTMPKDKQDERDAALNTERHHRRIKDEMLAYLREGRVTNMKKTLFGDLYKHLFADQPTEKRKQEDRALVTKISDELDRCFAESLPSEGFLGNLVYALMGVKLRRFPEYLASMRGLWERISALDSAVQGDHESDMSDIEMLPSVYQEDYREFLKEERAANYLVQKAYQARNIFFPDDDSRSFLALREEIKAAAAKKAERFETITRGQVFPPYLKFCASGLSKAEELGEQEVRTSILDALSTIADTTLQNVCRMHSADAELLVISEDIKIILAGHGRAEPVVVFSIAEKGVQVHVRYQVPQSSGALVEVSDVYVLTRSRMAGLSKTPRARQEDFDDAVVCMPDDGGHREETAPAVRQTREITMALEGAEAAYAVERHEFDLAIKEGQPHYIVVDHARNVQSSKKRVEQALQAFFRNGAHLPDIMGIQGVDLWDERMISPPTAKAIEGLRNALFDVASTYSQERIDDAVYDIESDADPDMVDRVQKQFDALIVKQLGGRQFGVGKIKNIRCSGVYSGVVTGTLGARVSFEAQRQSGGFLPATVDVIFHQTAH